MGFLDDLLTGKGPSLETRSLSTISPEQRELLNDLMIKLNRSPTAYTGERSAGLTGLEHLSLGGLEEASRGLAQPDQNLDAAGNTIRGQMDVNKNTGDANAFFTNAVQNPALKDFSSTVLPSISRNFGGGSFFSTERQNAEGTARRDLIDSLSAERSRVNLDQFNQARERALTAAGMAPALSSAENERSRTQIDILKAAGIERQVNQDALDRTYQEFTRQQEDQARREALMSQNALTPTIENIGMTDPGSAGLISTLLGGLAQGAGGILGQAAGNGLQGLLGRLFGGGAPAAGGGASADPNTGTTVTDTSGAAAGAVGAGAVGAGAAAGGGALPGAAAGGVPGGSVSITDMAGNVIPSVPYAGGAGLGGLVGGVQPGIASGIAGTEAANAAALGNIAAPSLGGSGAAGGGAALGGGASADAAGGAAVGTTAAGLTAGLGIAALPALIMAMGGFGDDRNRRENLAIQESGMEPLTLSSGTRALMLPDHTFIEDNNATRQAIRERWGVIPRGQFFEWLNTLPRVTGSPRRLPGRDPRHPGSPRPLD